jgi:hypothetical protein
MCRKIGNNPPPAFELANQWPPPRIQALPEVVLEAVLQDKKMQRNQTAEAIASDAEQQQSQLAESEVTSE